jgi:hypothetical protein
MDTVRIARGVISAVGCRLIWAKGGCSWFTWRLHYLGGEEKHGPGTMGSDNTPYAGFSLATETRSPQVVCADLSQVKVDLGNARGHFQADRPSRDAGFIR